VHDHGQPARQSYDRLLDPAAPGDLHRPSLRGQCGLASTGPGVS
jgi:hypothetical protein